MPAAAGPPLQLLLTIWRPGWPVAARPSHNALSYQVAIHFLIGILTGSVFRVRVLLGLVAVVLFECLAAALALGAAAALWPLTGLVAVQIGYLGGLLIRSVLEKAGLAEPGARVGDVR